MISKPSFPHSPESSSTSVVSMTLSKSHSPISLLALDLDSSLCLSPEYLLTNSSNEVKTPRRSLLSQLATMTRDTKDDAMMICDSSPYARSQPPLKSGRLLNTSVMGDGSTRPIRPLSYPSCKDSKKGSKYGSDQGRDQKNPFTQVEDFKPKPEGYKLKLKCRDQNELRDRRTIQSHWNFKKSTMPVKRRELENPSPNTMILPGKRIKGDPAPKIRRAMTFNGVQNTGSIIDDFNTPLPLLPSFLEDGKDMIRRITPATLSNALSGVYNNDIGELHLIDCRYPFEFLGGHIQTAVNMTSISDLESKFFTQIKTKKTVLIFHCEYSVQRAPQM